MTQPYPSRVVCQVFFVGSAGGTLGIGKGIAKSFLGAGHKVMIADLASGDGWRYRLGSETEMADTVRELSDLGTVRCTPVDVTATAPNVSGIALNVAGFEMH